MFLQRKNNLTSFTVPLRGEYTLLVEDFVMMVEMGFFVLTGRRYQMTIPTGLSMKKIKMAALRLAQAEHQDFLHPEYLVGTMPFAEAKAWQDRLRNKDTAHRCADRALRLDGYMFRGINSPNGKGASHG